MLMLHMHMGIIFQSTLPARGATFRLLAKVVAVFDFNPRSPHGERRSRRKLSVF